MLFPMVCHAQSGHVGKQLNEQTKKEMKQNIQDALNDKLIDQAAYQKIMGWIDSPPCHGVDRQLREQDKPALAKMIAQHEKLEKVDVLKSLRFQGWYIIYINNYVSDEPYLFYIPVIRVRRCTR